MKNFDICQQTTDNRQQVSLKTTYSLKNLNTMGFDIAAKQFHEINSLNDIDNLIGEGLDEKNTLILGCGSNTFFKEEYYDGTIIHSNLKGINIIEENGNDVIVRCMSGESWDNLVNFTIKNNLFGLENLIGIPGNVGAAPVQNIGAYGCEAKDSIIYVYTIDLTNGARRIFKNEDCHFAYRDSIFKREEYKKYFICAIDFCLKKDACFKLEYGNVKEYLEKKNISTPTLSDVAQTIKEIRASKLPEVGVIGSVGSFFQNPIVKNDTFEMLKESYPDMPSYPNEKGVKIPAGWLIDKAGWKGYRENHVGVWDKQALVLVHYGGGKPQEILDLMKKIQGSMKEKFGIDIEPEVNIC